MHEHLLFESADLRSLGVGAHSWSLYTLESRADRRIFPRTAGSAWLEGQALPAGAGGGAEGKGTKSS